MNKPKSKLIAALCVTIALMAIRPARADQLQQEINAKQEAVADAAQHYAHGNRARSFAGTMEMNAAVKQLLALPIMPVRTEGSTTQLTVVYAESKPGARDQEFERFLKMRVHDKHGRLIGGRWTLEARNRFPLFSGGEAWVVIGTLDFVGR